ncbi:hypothetical protein [Infirmifilum sp. SLHALR2]|nr:MAG: hypothetical protein B7L53_07335 [Thermofilum sp. NZ13]
MPGRAFLYVGDVFRPLHLSLGEVLEAWERDRLGLFELVRGEVERELGEVRGSVEARLKTPAGELGLKREKLSPG